MKTLATLLKLAMLVTKLSFVMSCDKNNKRTNNTTTGIYTYGANGSCINNQTGQQMPLQYCQQQYNNGYGYGSQQCNGNGNLYVWSYADQSCASQPTYTVTNGQQTLMCWKSCQYTNCSGQIAYPGNTGQYTQYNQYNQYNQGYQTQPQGYQCL